MKHLYLEQKIINNNLKQNIMKQLDFESNTLRLQTSLRGGGIEISLDVLNIKKFKGFKMTAYQNYLGGGMLGGIGNDCTFPNWEDSKKLVATAKQLREYFFAITNPDEDEWESQTFEQNETMPLSAY